MELRHESFYMAVKGGNAVNYLGLTSTPATRFYNHPKFNDPQNVRFFCGEIVSQGIAGPRKGRHKPDLSLAEHALIAYLKPSLNERLTRKDLDDDVVVYSRFFKPDGETVHHPLPKFPTGYRLQLVFWSVGCLTGGVGRSAPEVQRPAKRSG